jgi:AraC-like DNA-binding protein
LVVIATFHGIHFDQLFRANVLLSARARSHQVRAFSGPLSIKSVVRGEARWGIGGQSFTVDRGACLIVARGEPYDMFVNSPDPIETYVVFFADRLAADVAIVRTRSLERLLADPFAQVEDQPSITRRLWLSDSAIALALRRLRATDPAESGNIDAQLRGMLDVLADLTAAARAERDRIDAASVATRAELHRRVVRGRNLIDETIPEPFDLDAIAREACLSPHHFHRTFSAAFKIAPYEYVAQRRIERARRLLEESSWPVCEVCAAVGYESLPSFTTRFRRVVGVPPAAYRGRIRKDR